ncbi:MAG: ATP synthase F1 subunit delta [Caldilineae bacterium]|nr:MAG: ATP synthase F1 subunit delta [Caldilineae bacterium]
MERTPEAYTRGILAAVLEPWIDGLSKVGAAYVSNGDLRARLSDPAVEPETKAGLLEGLLPDGSPQELRNFLHILAANNDLGFVDDILTQLTRVVREEAGGPQKAVITSAVELDEDEKEKIRARLIERFGANLEFIFAVDPEILGGLVVQVGDKLIDDSVRGRIDALRQQLGVRTRS